MENHPFCQSCGISSFRRSQRNRKYGHKQVDTNTLQEDVTNEPDMNLDMQHGKVRYAEKRSILITYLKAMNLLPP
jgi:hypothetical protein